MERRIAWFRNDGRGEGVGRILVPSFADGIPSGLALGMRLGARDALGRRLNHAQHDKQQRDEEPGLGHASMLPDRAWGGRGVRPRGEGAGRGAVAGTRLAESRRKPVLQVDL